MTRRRRRMPKDDKAIKVLGVVEEDEETSELVSRMEREADAEIASRTVTLRWGKRQIDTVKRAAALMGVPYQTYLKLVVYRQAVADIAQEQTTLKQG
jgi:predicted DNA binding CopG/RHH family protein